MTRCQYCGDEKGTFDIAHVCSSGVYAPKISKRIVDGYLITESDTRVTARPITDADRYAFLKTLPHHQIDRVMYAEPDSWDAIIDNLTKEQK